MITVGCACEAAFHEDEGCLPAGVLWAGNIYDGAATPRPRRVEVDGSGVFVAFCDGQGGVINAGS